MLAYYYQTKRNKIKREIEFADYYNYLLNTATRLKDISSSCRVCLQKCHSSISSHENSIELMESLKVFANVDVKSSEFLCINCLKFIKFALSFRKIALHSNEIFKNALRDIKVKEEFLSKEAASSNKRTPEKNVHNIIGSKSDDVPEERKKRATKVSCPTCGKVLTKYALKQHLLLHDPNRKKYVCHVCGKVFGLPMSFRRHTLRHRTDFPYKCKICPYRGQFAELLKSHMRSHTKDYRYMCTECPARFIFISNLNSHMLKHKEPQFKCDTCKRGFHTKPTLEKHIKYDHLSIKDHFCYICDKVFGNRRARLQHERGVHKREKLTYRRMPSYLKAETSDQD